MEWVDALATLVGSIGLPVVLVIGGGWFVIQRVWPALVNTIWPDLVRLIELYATALSNVAHALERVAEKLPDPQPWTLGEGEK